MQLPKLVITDIDGVWTDGGMYYGDNIELKKFNTSDSAGVLFLKLLNIPLAIITGENSIAVANRAKKLNINLVYLGINDKLEVAKNLCEHLSIDLQEIAFIGDDINDWDLLEKVGFSATPANAPSYIKKVVDEILTVKGGEGAFREFVEIILKKSNKFDYVLSKYRRSKTR